MVDVKDILIASGAEAVDVDEVARLAREEANRLAGDAELRYDMEAFKQALLRIGFDAQTADIIQEENGFRTI